MGSVYQALHLGLNRLFALKLVLPAHAADPTFQAFFRAEALALGRLRHPGIVGVTDFGVDPRGTGIPFLVMDYLEGRSLGDLLKEKGPIEPSQALPILEQVAQAVDHAHLNGVLHRDIKPLNIFITEGPDREPMVKVLDFGLAHLLEGPHREPPVAVPDTLVQDSRGSAQDGLDTIPIQAGFATRPVPNPEEGSTLPIQAGFATRPVPDSEEGFTFSVQAVVEQVGPQVSWPAPAEVVGTPAYLAPEVLALKPAAPAADVYAFGIMAYEVLTGRLPFQGPIAEVLEQQRRAIPPSPLQFNPGIPEELEQPLLAPMAKQPEKRPATLQAVVGTLRRALDVHTLREWERKEAPRRRGLALWAAVAAFILAWGSTFINFVRGLENRSQDLRMSISAPRSADPRIVLVSLDEKTLDDGSANFFERADRLVRGVDELLKAGVAGVAIDLILPRRFSESETLSRLVLANKERLVLGLYATPAGQAKGWECLSALTRSVLGTQAELASVFGLVNLEPESDGCIRAFRTRLRASDGSVLEPMAVRLAHCVSAPVFRSDAVLIDHAIDPAGSGPVLPTVTRPEPHRGGRGRKGHRSAAVTAAGVGGGSPTRSATPTV